MNKLSKIFLTVLLVFMFACPAFADSDASAVVDGVTATGNANNVQTFEASKRAFANQGNVQYGVVPGYFGDNSKPGHQFISLAKLLMYNTKWKIADAPFKYGIKFNYTPYTKEVSKDQRSEYVICTTKKFDQAKYNVQLLAIGTMNSTDKRVISSNLLSVVLNKAAAFGATHVQFLAEGTNTELSASGWGIGFNYTKATDSSVSTGGTGYSVGYAGYDNLPWQQFMFLKVTPKETDSLTQAEKTFEPTASTVVTTKVSKDSTVDLAVKSKTVQ